VPARDATSDRRRLVAGDLRPAHAGSSYPERPGCGWPAERIMDLAPAGWRAMPRRIHAPAAYFVATRQKRHFVPAHANVLA